MKLRTATCRIALMATLGCMASCGPESKDPPPSPTPGYKPLSQRINEKNGYQVDSKGNWKPTTDRRSSFETKGESPYFKGNYDKKSYQSKPYEKKSWEGNQSYEPKTYQGNTDGSRFQTTSSSQGQVANVSGKDANLNQSYRTDSYDTPNARESGLDPMAKPSNSEVDRRRKIFAQPEIIDWREQRSMSMEQSKSILGR